MSPLTKIFVGLLVVLVLLYVAASVTFFSTLDDQKKAASVARQQIENTNASLLSQKAEAEAQAAQAQEARRLAESQSELVNQRGNDDRKELANKDVELAAAGSRAAMQSADITRLSDALKASEDAKSRMQEMIVAIRSANDTALQQAAQSSTQINDLQNRLEVTERERRYATEQLEEMRNQVGKLSAAVQEMGRNPSEILASMTSGPSVATPKINGVVREVRTIAGLPYATVSIGSADGVSKGMVFNIVERNGAFLGKLTIDTVELNESTGRIAGPNDKLSNVKAGVEVKTQL